MVSGGKRKDIFWRTNSSGAKYKQTGEKQHAGDIVPACREGEEFAGKFLIEAKWKRDFCWNDISTAVKWMKKYEVEACTIGKLPLVLAKGHKGKIYLLSLLDSKKFLAGLTAELSTHMLIKGKYVVTEVSSWVT